MKLTRCEWCERETPDYGVHRNWRVSETMNTSGPTALDVTTRHYCTDLCAAFDSIARHVADDTRAPLDLTRPLNLDVVFTAGGQTMRLWGPKNVKDEPLDQAGTKGDSPGTYGRSKVEGP